VPWLEREIGRFYAPQLIQCRVCLKYKPADPRLFRAIRTSDVLRTTCRGCEHKTAYGRRLTTRANAIKLDPSLPAPFKQHLILSLPDQVRLSKTTRLKRAHGMEHNDAMKAMWRRVAHMISVRRSVLVSVLTASRHTGGEGSPGGRLHQMFTSTPICHSYITELLALYTTIGVRLRNTHEWGEVVDWHLPPKHWRDAIQQLTFCKPETSQYRRLCESMSPWEFTTPADRARLGRYDMLKLEEGDFTRFTWVSIISRGEGMLMRRMYPEMPMPGQPYVGNITPDWMRTYNGYPAPALQLTGNEPASADAPELDENDEPVGTPPAVEAADARDWAQRHAWLDKTIDRRTPTPQEAALARQRRTLQEETIKRSEREHVGGRPTPLEQDEQALQDENDAFMTEIGLKPRA